MSRWVVRCPAKVNLGLRIVGPRSDGYHDLETTFQAIDLWDTLTLAPSAALALTCDRAELDVGPHNLVLRAARRLDPSRGAEMQLRKRIPLQGGLGGGSSDAAGALLGLCRLWDLDPGPQALQAAAAELGADVPFFLTGGRALGRGRGDRIEPLSGTASLELVLGTPPFGVPTAWAFAAWDERLTGAVNDVSLSRLFAHKLQRNKDLGSLTNDLEPVVFERHPELRRFRDALLEAGAQHALLSGSGSTIFGTFEGDAAAAAGAAALVASRFPGWAVRHTRTIDGGVTVAAAADDETTSHEGV